VTVSNPELACVSACRVTGPSISQEQFPGNDDKGDAGPMNFMSNA
jgi:hypothetical protein